MAIFLFPVFGYHRNQCFWTRQFFQFAVIVKTALCFSLTSREGTYFPQKQHDIKLRHNMAVRLKHGWLRHQLRNTYSATWLLCRSRDLEWKPIICQSCVDYGSTQKPSSDPQPPATDSVIEQVAQQLLMRKSQSVLNKSLLLLFFCFDAPCTISVWSLGGIVLDAQGRCRGEIIIIIIIIIA